MDPTANLEEQLRLSSRILGTWPEGKAPTDWKLDDALRLAELVQDLNEWISRGGFLPQAWTR